MGQQQSNSCFEIRNDESQTIPIRFSQDLVSSMEPKDEKALDLGENQDLVDLKRKLIFESKSAKDVQKEIESLLSKLTEIQPKGADAKIQKLHSDLLNCYYQKRPMDCWRERDLFLNEI